MALAMSEVVANHRRMGPFALGFRVDLGALREGKVNAPESVLRYLRERFDIPQPGLTVKAVDTPGVLETGSVEKSGGNGYKGVENVISGGNGSNGASGGEMDNVRGVDDGTVDIDGQASVDVPAIEP